MIEPVDGVSQPSVNQILIASDAPLPEIRIDDGDGSIVVSSELDAFIGDALVLTDDFAPADQLRD
jgi:hypothetical protein